MKPKNFPGRKRERQITALANAAKKANQEAAMRESTALHGRIVSASVARGIRTKKDRSARGNLRAA
jgi:hypothetical protein